MTTRELVQPSSAPSPTEFSLPRWLTIERALYALIALAAAGLRLAVLDRQPFTPDEARQAWSALARIQGEAALPAPGVSPLLLSLHWISFALLQASEGLARVWPALAGLLLVLLPYGLRRELGRPAALLASALLLVSASLTFWSRQATGESFTLLAALALVVCLAGIRREGPRAWAGWTAASLALLLLSSPAAYSALLMLLPLAFIWQRDLLAHLSERFDDSESPLTRAGLLLLLFLGLGSTALFTNPGGLAALADLPAVWLSQFARPDGYTWAWPWLQWLLDEPLLIVAGLVGLGLGLRRGDGLVRGLGLWLLLGLLLSLRPGRTPIDLALLSLPLALLGGQALAAFAASWQSWDLHVETAALLIGGAAILISAAIWLANYANSASGAAPLESVFLLSGLGSLALLVIVLILYGAMFDPRLATKIGLALLILALLVPGLRDTLRLSQNNDGLRWGSLHHTIGASDGPNLTAYLAQLASQRDGDLVDLSVVLVSPPGSEVPPLLRWYLRDADVRFSAGGAGAASDEVLVSMADVQPAVAENTSGRSFRLTQSWSPAGLRGGPFWRWLLFGHFDALESETRAVVWVQPE